MKGITLVASLFISAGVFAECPIWFENPDHLNEVVSLIGEQQSCDEAAVVAESCAYGSSADVQIAGAAAEICWQAAPEGAHKAALAEIETCKANGPQNGTIALSAAAFCHLASAKKAAQ